MYKAFQTHFTVKSGAQLINSQPYKCKDSDISTLLYLLQSAHRHRAANKLAIQTTFTNLQLNKNVDPICTHTHIYMHTSLNLQHKKTDHMNITTCRPHTADENLMEYFVTSRWMRTVLSSCLKL